MKIMQCTVNHLGHELWLDLMEVPPEVNDLKKWQEAGQHDMAKAGRRFRIIEVLEQ